MFPVVKMKKIGIYGWWSRYSDSTAADDDDDYAFSFLAMVWVVKTLWCDVLPYTLLSDLLYYHISQLY